MSTWRVVLIGGGIAVLVVALVVVLLVTGVLTLPNSPEASARGPVLVALVLRDESGVRVPRVVDVYTRTQAGWAITSVSPTLPAVVSGTSGRTLADAYVFGGGDALAKAYSAGSRTSASAWVVVDQVAWERLVGSTPMSLEIPAHMEVYDGQQLIPFEQGTASIPATETGSLLNGAAYLSTRDSSLVRARVGDVLAARLSRAGAQDVVGLTSSLDAAQLRSWLSGLGTVARASGE